MEKIIIGESYSNKIVKYDKKKKVLEEVNIPFRRRDHLLDYGIKNNLLRINKNGDKTLLLKCGKVGKERKVLFIIKKGKNEQIKEQSFLDQIV